MNEPEILVGISMRFPQLDRAALAEHLTPVVLAALRAGGKTTNVSLQPYDPDEEPDGG
jgi:hypothetical protein